MSVLQVQRCLYDHLRRLEQTEPGAPSPALSVDGYDLEADERRALVDGDVAALYSMGTHPVLINAFCRAQGWRRADYRVLLEGATVPGTAYEGRPRWRTS